jgi:hypothetical protein
MPQLPQFEIVFTGVSQPLPSRPSQLPQPELHPVSAQVPLAQLALPLLRLHGVPQLPQFASVLSGVSQPSWALQLPHPPLQV